MTRTMPPFPPRGVPRSPLRRFGGLRSLRSFGGASEGLGRGGGARMTRIARPKPHNARDGTEPVHPAGGAHTTTRTTRTTRMISPSQHGAGLCRCDRISTARRRSCPPPSPPFQVRKKPGPCRAGLRFLAISREHPFPAAEPTADRSVRVCPTQTDPWPMEALSCPAEEPQRRGRPGDRDTRMTRMTRG